MKEFEHCYQTPICILMLYKRCITKTETEAHDLEGLALAATEHLELLTKG